MSTVLSEVSGCCPVSSWQGSPGFSLEQTIGSAPSFTITILSKRTLSIAPDLTELTIEFGYAMISSCRFHSLICLWAQSSNELEPAQLSVAHMSYWFWLNQS